MKTALLHLIAILSLSLCVQAGETSTFKTNGLSLILNGPWEHVEKAHFGYVVRPKDANIKKVRIHPTRFKGVSLKDALDKTSERTKKNNDVTLAVTKVKTVSGIEVMKASVAKTGGKVYLERYFCLKPKGEIICICVYSFGNEAFSKSVEKALSQTLTIVGQRGADQPATALESKAEGDKKTKPESERALGRP